MLSVTRRDGVTVRLPESSLVAGKVVPAAPARRGGLPAAGVRELTRVAARSWPAPEQEPVGGWLCRAAGGWTRRANSAVPTGSSGGPAGEPDLERITAWYAARGLPAVLQVVTGAADGQEPLAARLDGRGWTASGHSAVRIGALAPLADREEDPRVHVGRELTGEWLRGYPRAALRPEAARAVLTGGPSVWFAAVAGRPGDGPAAVGRCVVDGRWAGFAAVEVSPAHRRRGLATAVMAELARAALADGASAGYLQVEADNGPARALYTALGFAEHHRYHYRTAPPPPGRRDVTAG